MSVQSVALASLTATYTDSEGDEGLDEEQQDHPQHHHRHAQRRRESFETPGRHDDETQQQNVSSQQQQQQQQHHHQQQRISNIAESPLFLGEDSRATSPEDVILGRLNDARDPQGIASGRKKQPAKRSGASAPTLVTDVTSKVQRLVSYFDDTIVSDDEMGTASALDDNRASNNGTTGNDDDALARKKSRDAVNAQSPKRRGELVSDNDNDEAAAAAGGGGGGGGGGGEEDEDDEASWGGVAIPPEPAGHCSAELQDKIANLYRKMESGGLDMNLHIQQRKEFRNPSIYEKLIQFCSINEMGTNYPPDRFDPFKWGKDSYYEELARIQKNEMDKLEKARKEKTKIEIVTGTAKRPNNNPSVAEDEAKRRKSKWDQVATGASTAVKSNVVMSQPTLTTLTSSATGTKATVISAFGSLPKKRL